MNQAAGDGSAGGGNISILYDRVMAIANQTVGHMQDQASKDHSHFKSARLGAGAFGHVPQAQDFHGQQAAAHEVFVKTIKGVLEDLEDFQANLKACAHGHQQNDEAIEASLTSMGARYGGGHHYHSHDKQLAASHDKRLKVEGQPGAVRQLDSGDQTAPNGTTPGGDGSDATRPTTGGYGNS